MIHMMIYVGKWWISMVFLWLFYGFIGMIMGSYWDIDGITLRCHQTWQWKTDLYQ